MEPRGQKIGQQANGAEAGVAAWAWIVLAVAAGLGLAVAVLPVLVPTLLGSMTGPAPHVFWYISRASAFVAYTLLWMSMLAGLGITNKLGRRWPGMPGSFELHRFTALLGIGFGMLHALVLLGDSYMNYTLTQLLVPFMDSNYRPEWVGLGQTSLYLLVIVALSFWVKDRIGVRTWRLIHVLSFALFLASLVHGLQSGTDSRDWWALALYWVSGASVLLASVYRVLSARSGHARESLEGSGLVVAPGRSRAYARRPDASPRTRTHEGRSGQQAIPVYAEVEQPASPRQT